MARRHRPSLLFVQVWSVKSLLQPQSGKRNSKRLERRILEKLSLKRKDRALPRELRFEDKRRLLRVGTNEIPRSKFRNHFLRQGILPIQRANLLVQMPTQKQIKSQNEKQLGLPK